MKTIQIPIVLLLLMFCMRGNGASIREQLNQANAHWLLQPQTNKEQDQQRTFSSDCELIQLHLQLVEKTLRVKYLRGLNEDQKKRRSRLLDELHNYWAKGLFPKNTAHAVRTPYFIDVYGTACAVGQLIISSGNPSLANQISREYNNGYITELVLKYPQIRNWANENGFTLEELAWIQPCYGPPLDTMGLRHPTCHSAMNGYFCPNFNQMQGPLTKSFYHWADTAWVPMMNMCGQWMFNYLKAGKYKWEVKDNQNTNHTFSVTLVAPSPATVTTIKSGDFKTCNGVITVSVQGGVSPFTYFWWGQTGNTPVLDSVCEELVNLSFYEAGSSCMQSIKIQTSPVGMHEHFVKALQLSPNPVSDVLQLKFDPAVIPEHKIAKILNSQGQLVLQTELQGEFTNINLGQLAAGLYFLQVEHYIERFVKQ